MTNLTPTFLFASRSRAQLGPLVRDVESMGIACKAVDDVATLREMVAQREVYLVIISIDFCDDPVALRRELAALYPTFWIMMSPRATPAHLMKLYNEGFQDIISAQASYVVIKSRALTLLERYLRKPGGSEGLALPAWFDRSKVVDAPAPRPTKDLSPSEEKKRDFAEAAAKLREQSGLGFSMVETVRERESLFRETADSKESILLWSEGRHRLALAETNRYDEDQKRLLVQYPLAHSTAASFRAWIEKHRNLDVFANFNNRRGRCFFLSEPSAFDFAPDAFHIPLPPQLFNVQRREEIRLALPDDLSKLCVARFGKRAELLKVVNLSAGGLCVQVPPGVTAFDLEHPQSCQIEFSFQGLNLKSRATLRWKKGDQLGLRLEDLDEATREQVRLLIFESMYEYLKTYVLMRSPVASPNRSQN